MLVLRSVLQEHNKSWTQDLLTNYGSKFAKVLSNVETHFRVVILEEFLKDWQNFLLTKVLSDNSCHLAESKRCASTESRLRVNILAYKSW